MHFDGLTSALGMARDIINMSALFILLYIGFVLISRGETKSSIRLLLITTLIVGGLNGVFAALKWAFEALRFDMSQFVVGPAIAADGFRAEVAPIIPWIIAGMLIVMAIIFAYAAFVLLTLKDVRENQARIRAADTIVKTFGGFFIGICTALLK